MNIFLKDLVDWQTLGLVLGLHYSTLEKIGNDHHNRIDKCKIAMLAAWLEQEDNLPQKPVPSWSVLQNALRRMRENELADRIMDYIGMCAPPPHPPVSPLSDL